MSETTTGTHAVAVVAHAADDLRVEQVAVRPPKNDEALLRIAYGGICGSDLHYWRHGAAGESILRAPMRLGHEASGVVVAAAADGSGPAAGTAVTIHPATPGGDPSDYPADRPNISPGCVYLGSAAHFPHADGLFVEQVAVPTRMLRELPDGLDLRTGSLAEPASVAWHAVARAGDVAGKKILVVGAGPIGALTVAVLARAGAGHITAVDLHDYPLNVALQVGANEVMSAADTETVAAVGADITIECSGNSKGLASAIAATKRGGRVVMVGLLPSGEQPVPISLAITRELDLVGSFRFNDEIDDVLVALADGSLVVEPIITAEYPVDDALEAFARAGDAANSSKVLLRW
ncbi:L-idonate 5-dehydrogenase [Gordonia sp. NB41Y]|uniref:L-idonate 5-dehydrogenase n=1 Tax=Gordonia sp. NB41Y TaxID=875808 RepID=UPI0006B1B81D|nr:L-idonate 5-dehydrogenase [Gordonia sp. NB41Y]EMP10690.2 zinc-binding alcohol dehydrogenase [Gordonia sp. NB41Y]WLP92859.1 L-idonate 5-dehydrogenase [Gordonia sp. NB41Y]